jgi:RHS repeat-associated protein
VSDTETVIFVYDAFGKLIAEYANQAPQNPQINYLTDDNLGSPRINTSQDGQILARHDYRPFGEEISTTQRTPGLGYQGNDSVRQTFTAYEKDSETDLDFAQARYYSKNLGRFFSVDPLGTSAQKWNPQTFNRYSYVVNNPVNYSDPNGTCVHTDNDGRNTHDDNKPCKNFSGQVYVKDGSFYNGRCKGCTPLANGATATASAYGRTYTITGGTNGGWTSAPTLSLWDLIQPTAHAQAEDALDAEESPEAEGIRTWYENTYDPTRDATPPMSDEEFEKWEKDIEDHGGACFYRPEPEPEEDTARTPSAVPPTPMTVEELLEQTTPGRTTSGRTTLRDRVGGGGDGSGK